MVEVLLDGVSKTFPGGTQALRNVTLRAEPGETVVLVGPSGCGKTTSLRIIAGLEAPTCGTVRIGGRDVTALPAHHRDTALVFQRPNLYPHLSVLANLGFGLAVRRPFPLLGWLFKDGARARRIAEVAELLGLTDLLGRKPAQLSGGQQQRVALGRALVRAPAVYLLDEPFGSLDSPLRVEMRRELHLLRRRLRATIFHVTHDQEEALALGDRVAVLDRGAVQQVDRPEALCDRPTNRFVAGFLGGPSASFLDGTLVEVEGQLALRGQGVTLPLAGGPSEWRAFLGRGVTVGARPEHVALLNSVGEEGAPGPAALTTAVRLVERSGSGLLVSLERDGWALTALLAGTALAPPAVSSLVGARVDVEHAHLFDRHTGLALAHGRAAFRSSL
jgi:multiple sugar transport system ATP-binding protein